jgi:hypothetical protein
MTIQLDIETKSNVVGVGRDGILIGSGRTVGYHPVG